MCDVCNPTYQRKGNEVATPTKYYEAYWDGPHDVKDLQTVHGNNVLYMICGTHGLYGRNVPLYIGKTEQKVHDRINQHSGWINDEPDPVKVYVACIGEFYSWSENEKIESYPPPLSGLIEQIESLLIYAHQPVYNTRSKQGNFQSVPPITVFNTGHRSTLYPEVSSLRWLGD